MKMKKYRVHFSTKALVYGELVVAAKDAAHAEEVAISRSHDVEWIYDEPCGCDVRVTSTQEEE